MCSSQLDPCVLWFVRDMIDIFWLDPVYYMYNLFYQEHVPNYTPFHLYKLYTVENTSIAY
jgi:hypothetical protein